MRLAPTLALCAALATPAAAQSGADLIRLHFSGMPGGSEALETAQRVLMASGQPVQPTGIWDAATAQAFQTSINTMRAIGFTGLDTDDPFTLTRIVMDWHLGALRSEIGLQDFPD
ncbi:hypothetical protein [Gymnodinialimonas sp.]